MLRASRAFEGHEPEKKGENILTLYLIRHEVHTKYNITNPYICFQVFSAPPAFSFTPTQLDTNHNNIKIEYVLSYMKININCKLLIDFLPSCHHDLHNQGFQTAQ